MLRSASRWQKCLWMNRSVLCRAGKETVGYGPFSMTVKGRAAREKKQREVKRTVGGRGSESRGVAENTASVMSNIQLSTNLYLRLSLASLIHPTQLERVLYQSPEWRLVMVRLYRAILRLHNKTVAVSLEKSTLRGAATPGNSKAGADTTSSPSAVSGVDVAVEKVDPLERDEKVLNRSGCSSSSILSEGETGVSKFPDANLPCEVTMIDRFVLKYLLNDAQRAFGNRFVRDEFHRHTDADHVAASIFYRSWYEYVLQLSSGVTTREMTDDEKHWLTDEQREKLEQLKSAFRQFNNPQKLRHMS